MTDASQLGGVLARHPQIAAAWLFGSVARGEARPDSDLDVAILLRDEPSDAPQRWLHDLVAELERFSPSGRVDLVLLGRQGPVFRHRILAQGTLVHDADREARFAFEERTTRDYLDWKPTHDIAMRSTFSGLRDRFGVPRSA